MKLSSGFSALKQLDISCSLEHVLCKEDPREECATGSCASCFQHGMFEGQPCSRGHLQVNLPQTLSCKCLAISTVGKLSVKFHDADAFLENLPSCTSRFGIHEGQSQFKVLARVQQDKMNSSWEFTQHGLTTLSVWPKGEARPDIN